MIKSILTMFLCVIGLISQLVFAHQDNSENVGICFSDARCSHPLSRDLMTADSCNLMACEVTPKI
jgi:hypothetical protein